MAALSPLGFPAAGKAGAAKAPRPLDKGSRVGFQVELLSGDSDWPQVMAGLDGIKYQGWIIAEQYRPPGLTDADWLSGISTKMDQILVS